MALAVPIFADDIEFQINRALWVFALALMLWALVHAVLQRADGFTAAGSLSKGAWLGILGGLLLLTAISRGTWLLFQLVGIGAAAFYLLDTRRGLKDASDGPW